MSRITRLFLVIAALVAVSGFMVACGSSDNSSDDSSQTPGLTLANCGDVEYGGSGDFDSLIVSDLPLQGDSETRSTQMNAAIKQVLQDNNWTAAGVKVGFQPCDDSIAKTGLWDEATCKDNANAYAGDTNVIGVIGTYNSGCAEAMIPILNQAEEGAVPMISPGNTAVCLTETASTCLSGEPDSLYPTGDRNYARVVPNDAFQGAGLATFAKSQGSTKVAVLYAKDDPTSKGQADTFTGAAQADGLTIATSKPWDPEAKDYTSLMKQVGDSGADAVLLAGLTEQNGGQLIKDKVSVLGPNNGDVALYAPDGFNQQSTIDEAGSASKDMFASIPGTAPELLPAGPGQTLVKELTADSADGTVETYAPYAGQAVQVLLDAINKGGSDRGAVATALYDVKVKDGITGTFDITDTGDPSVGPVTISQAGSTFKPIKVVKPANNLVTAARGN